MFVANRHSVRGVGLVLRNVIAASFLYAQRIHSMKVPSVSQNQKDLMDMQGSYNTT